MRMRPVYAAVCGLAFAAASVAGASVASAPPSQVAARRAVPRLLAALRLPPGAVSVAREPSGDHGLLRPLGGLTATSARVDRHAWWRVPGTPSQVIGYVRGHPPRGGQLLGTGSGPSEQSVDYRWPALSGVSSRALEITAVALSRTTTGVLAQAEAVWIVPRPQSERVPNGAREVDVTSGPVGRAPTRSLTVSDRVRVRRLVALIDHLPIDQPAAISCFSERLGGAWSINLIFRAWPGGPALARVHYLDLAPLDTPSGPCTAIEFWVHGRRRTPLIGGNFVPRLDHVLGIRLTG